MKKDQHKKSSPPLFMAYFYQIPSSSSDDWSVRKSVNAAQWNTAVKKRWEGICTSKYRTGTCARRDEGNSRVRGPVYPGVDWSISKWELMLAVMSPFLEIVMSAYLRYLTPISLRYPWYLDHGGEVTLSPLYTIQNSPIPPL